MLEHAVAEHQVGAARLDDLEQPGGVALHRAHLDAGLAGPALQRGQRVRAGVDDGDPVAELGERDGEPAGAAADVQDVEAGGSRPSEHLAQHVPHHRGARRVRQRRGHAVRLSTRAARTGVPELARRLRAFLAGGCLGVVAGRLEVGVRRLAEPARVHQHPARPAHATGRPGLSDLARLVDLGAAAGRVAWSSPAGSSGSRPRRRPSGSVTGPVCGHQRRDRVETAGEPRARAASVSSQQPVARIETPRGPVRRTWPRITSSHEWNSVAA